MKKEVLESCLINLKNFNYSVDLKQVLENNKNNEDADTLFKTKIEIITEVKILRDLIDKEQTTVEVISNRRSSFYAHYDRDKKFPPEKLKDLKAINTIAKKILIDFMANFIIQLFSLAIITGQ